MCIDHDPYQTQAPAGRKVYMGTCCQTPVTPLGFKRLLDTVFYIPVAPLVLRCDLPKPRGGEDVSDALTLRTKLTPMVRLETAPTEWNQVNWVLRATRDKQITCVYFNTIFKWYFSLYAYTVTF